MSVLELAQLVQVRDALLAKVDTILEVERFDVVLNILTHGLPAMLGLNTGRSRLDSGGGGSNAKGRSIGMNGLIDDSGIVHELLRDASNVHASTCSFVATYR